MGLRTLLISPVFDGAIASGGVLYSMDVTREWLRRGREVAVLCVDRPRKLGDLDEFVKQGRLKLYPIASQEQFERTHFPHASVAAGASQAIAAFAPDVIHVHNTHGMLSAAAAANQSPAPVLLTALDFGLICLNFYLYHGSGDICPGQRSTERCSGCIRCSMKPLARWAATFLPRTLTKMLWPGFVRMDQLASVPEQHGIMQQVLEGVDAIIAPSPIVAQRMRTFGAKRVAEILYGVQPDKVLRPAKKPSEVVRLAYLGGPERVKGLSVLIEAVLQLPDGLPLEIRAYGGNMLRYQVNASPRLARRYLRYCPSLFGADLAREYADTDAVLVPSLWHENSPFVVLESLANGTPVIAADQAGIRELIEPERNGRLLPPGRADAWAEAMSVLTRYPDALRKMAEHAHFERRTSDFVDDVEGLERELLGERDAAGTSARA